MLRPIPANLRRWQGKRIGELAREKLPPSIEEAGVGFYNGGFGLRNFWIGSMDAIGWEEKGRAMPKGPAGP